MEFLIPNGIQWIIAIQAWGAWLEWPMKFFTFLGTDNFMFLILPLLYWSIDAGIGIRVALILAVSDSLKLFLKMLFAGPRPYWVSAAVKAYVYEGSFGIPSGHAQDATVLWGTLAVNLRKRWVWIVALLLIFLIGFSRLYLGAHFVHDVLAGWLIGSLILGGFTKFWNPVETWIKKQKLGSQILLAFLVSLIFIGLNLFAAQRLAGYVFPAEWRDNALRSGPIPDPVSMESPITIAATFFGLAVGLAWLAPRGGYQAAGPIAKRALRFVVGVIGVLILWRGLELILPNGTNLVAYSFRYIRYTLVGFWISAGAPWLFFRIKLAKAQM